MAGKDQIAGGFTAASRNVYIAAKFPGRLLANQLLPVFPLANQLIGGGKVHDDFRPVQCQQGAGRQRGPKILAQLHTKGHPVPAANHLGLGAHLRQQRIGGSRLLGAVLR